jgi:hypothetical protein
MSFMVVTPAYALFDLRAGYGLNNGSPSDINDTLNSAVSGATTFKSLPGFNIDAIVKIPMVPIGFGLRYENLGGSVSTAFPGASSSMDAKLTFERTALLVNYRIIDTLVYLGGLATYGIMNSSNFNFDCPACTGLNHFAAKSGSASSYSVGVEGGVKLPVVNFGAEVGYASFVGKDYTDGGNKIQDSTGANAKFDLTGLYAKILLGVGF